MAYIFPMTMFSPVYVISISDLTRRSFMCWLVRISSVIIWEGGITGRVRRLVGCGKNIVVILCVTFSLPV